MLCPRCYGKHVVLLNGSRIPCPECSGVGELHCCDGLREQGECPLPPPRPTAPLPREFAGCEPARTAS
jgi:hypothetical protein